MSSDIKEVKSIIRGLLTSSAEEMTVGKLRHDYKTQEGRDIPFYDFKFRDVTSFLRSIPDVCQICDNPYGPYPIVRLVESEKSAHISSLVMRQRPSTKIRRRPILLGNGSYKSPQSTIRRTPLKPVRRTTKCELSFTKPVINSVTTSLNVLAPEFNATVSNFSAARDLASLQVPKCDSVGERQNDGDAFPTSGSHVEVPAEIDDGELKILLKNVITNHQALFITFGELEESLKLSLSLLGCKTPVDIVKIESILRLLPEFEIKGNSVCCIPKQNKSSGLPEHHLQLESEENNISEMDKDVNGSPQNNHIEELLFSSGSSESNDKVQRLERNLYSMMKDCSNGILISELIQSYKMRFAAPLNLQIVGCNSAEELVDKMSTIFSCEPTENGDIKLYPAWLPKSQRNGNSKNIPRTKTNVPPLIKRNIQWLMERYPDGIPSNNFQEKYQDTFYGEVDLTEMGFATFKDFFSCLEEEGLLQICESDFDTWLVPMNKSVEIPVNEDPIPPLSPDTEEDIKELKSKFPIDVMGPDAHVKPEKIPPWVKKCCMIEIRVQDVHNPHNFWISFVGEQYFTALEYLMDDMQAFYCSYGHSYRMPAELVRKGQDCVCLFNGEWNRARVLRFVEPKHVELFYYDYGTLAVVPQDALYFLHSSFTELPAQAIRAVLANLSPKGDAWSKDTAKRFLNLIFNRPLIGIVHNVDRQNNVLSLYLCDTNGNEDIYINDVLKQEGYAVESSFDATESLDLENFADFKSEDVNTEDAKDVELETNFREETGVSNNDQEISFSVTQEVFPTSKILDSPETDGEDNQDVRMSVSNNSMHKPLKALDEVCDLKPDKSQSIEKCESNISTHFDAVSSETKSHVSKLAPPPPGFSHNSKNKEDVNDSFVSNQAVGKGTIGSEGLQPSQKSESSSEHFYHPSKRVNSGVNANFLEDLRTRQGTAQPGYSGWNASPFQTPGCFQPPYNPLNAAPPVFPVGLPPFTNPLDLYSAWYYEQMRQQAFIRGALIHQQLTAAMLPPIPNGLFLAHNQNQRPSEKYVNNQIHISELPCPPFKNVNKPQVALCVNSAATQTEGTGNSSPLNITNVSPTSCSSVSSETSDVPLTRREQINGLVFQSNVAVQTACNEKSTFMSLNCSDSPSRSLDVDEVQSKSAVSESKPVQKTDSRIDMLHHASSHAVLERENSVSAERTSTNNDSVKNLATANPEKLDTIILTPFNRRKSVEMDSTFNTKRSENSHENSLNNITYLNKDSSSGINPSSRLLNIGTTEGKSNIIHSVSHEDDDETSCIKHYRSSEERNLSCDPSFSCTEAKRNMISGSTSNLENKMYEKSPVQNLEQVKYVNVVLKPISSTPESIAECSQQIIQKKVNLTNALQTNSEESNTHISIVNGVSNVCEGVTNCNSKDHKSVTSELLESLTNFHIKEEKSSISMNCSEQYISETKVLDNCNHFTQEKGNQSETSPNTRSRVCLEGNGGNVDKNLTRDDQEVKYQGLNLKLPDSSRMKIANNLYSHNRLPVSSSPLHITKINSISEVVNLPKRETSSETWSTTWNNMAHSVASKTDAKHSVSGPNSTRKNGSIRYSDCNTLSKDGKSRFVKKAKLLDHVIHLINLDGRPYVPTDEIVRNFTSFNGHHVVLKILDARKIEINFLELCRRRRPDIFDHLDKTDIKYVSRGPTGNIIGSLHIVPLRSIPYMLKALNKESQTISLAVQEQMNNFDPNDLYWQGL